MTLKLEELEGVDQHWAVGSVPEDVRESALRTADERLAEIALGGIMAFSERQRASDDDMGKVALAYEMAAIEGIEAQLHPSRDAASSDLRRQAQAGAYNAFRLYRALPVAPDADQRIFQTLHLAGLAYCGDRWTDLKRWLNDFPRAAEIPSHSSAKWDKRLLYRLYDCWLRLLRKESWDDLSRIAEIIPELRAEQSIHESKLLRERRGMDGKAVALQLVALYHFAKATESLAKFMLQGDDAAIDSVLDQHFEAAIRSSRECRDAQLETTLTWLHLASRKMVESSLWWIAHSVNSSVTHFIEHVTKSRSMFELLPPQRAALRDAGLLDLANRAIVVDLPTSGGKTQLSQFRMLQALNQFEHSGSWVAYVAPTRALVSQITRRLRSDFEPLGISVEQLSSAIEIDAFEESLLGEDGAFQVLVSTPEKLQLVIRNKKIRRPLSLIVMDEAHNIEDEHRGLRIELLLATIKQERPTANFLLLMPFVPNPKDLAQWLAADRGQSISLGTTAWQPNERLVGTFNVQGPSESEAAKRGDWKLGFKTLLTPHRTIHLSGEHRVGGIRPLASFSRSKIRTNLSAQAVAMAKSLSGRGTSIAVAQSIPNAWRMARIAAEELSPPEEIPSEIELVQRYVATEISGDFELIGLLAKGVAVHHAGLPSEVLALIEWLTERNHIRVLCATTTIAQGLNLPVSSVFLASTKFPYGKQMSYRSFWNLAGRAGRIGQDSVGIVGIAEGSDRDAVHRYVSGAAGDLLSRMETLLDDLHDAGELDQLSERIMEEQWDDFRSYIAHLWNEKRDIDLVIGEAERTLRNTFGYGALRSRSDEPSLAKADALLRATRNYVLSLAEHPENATLADATGFSPEGVRTAILEMRNLGKDLSAESWDPSSLFGDAGDSTLPHLMGIMMRVPRIREPLNELAGSGFQQRNLARITQAWVSGKSLVEIADTFLGEGDFTEKISKICKAIYRDLSNNAAWGLSALSKMPGSGLDFGNMSDEEKRRLNLLPAMVYHGVRTEEGVLMRMNSVPRSIAEATGREFRDKQPGDLSTRAAKEYLRDLRDKDWDRLKPKGSSMSGADYRAVWRQLSGL